MDEKLEIIVEDFLEAWEELASPDITSKISLTNLSEEDKEVLGNIILNVLELENEEYLNDVEASARLALEYMMRGDYTEAMDELQASVGSMQSDELDLD